MSSAWSPQFVFAACQRGAELALKKECAARLENARPAFSRPGFVTFKLDQPCLTPEKFQFPGALARTFGFCLGKIQGDHLQSLAEQSWQLPAVQEFLAAHLIDNLHVWQRDADLPGKHGFEPGVTPLAQEAEAALRTQSPLENLQADETSVQTSSRRNRWVLDVAMVEPTEWWIGCHRTARRCDCWPGGVPPLVLPEHAVNRAYLKMKEALLWSALPIVPGNLCVELGCAPGGASQALLEAAVQVIGVDPAEVDPAVESHPRFSHLRQRTMEIPQRHLLGVHWIVADMNVAPKYTLDAAEAIVTQPNSAVRGMVLTLKLSDWKLLDQLSEYMKRIRSWGYRDVRARQLAFNRQEICVVALRSRAQRRVRRKSRKQRRIDPAQKRKTCSPHFSSSTS